MAPRRRPPDVHEALPGMPTPQYPPIDRKSRPSLSKALSPEFTFLDPAAYADITSEQLAEVTAGRLQPALIDVPRGSRGAVSYAYDYRRYRRITVTGKEFKVLAGSIVNLGTGADAASFGNRQDSEVARRAGVHAVESALPSLQHLESHYQEHVSLAEDFKLASTDENIGRAMFGFADNMSEQLTRLREIVFGEMVLTAGYQRGWSESDISIGKRGIDRLIILSRAHNARIGHFRRLVALAATWNGYRLEAAQVKIAQGQKYLLENQPTQTDEPK